MAAPTGPACPFGAPGGPLVPAALTPRQKRALDGASAFAARGWAPIALRGKRPLAKGWPGTTPADWRERWVAGAENVGLCTGQPGGFVAVDIDLKDGGMDRWEELVKAHGEPRTVTVRTGSGGLHYYFAVDERAATLNKSIKCVQHASGAPAGIDLIAAGGQVVAPPSIHPNRRPYTYIVPPDDYPVLPPMPDWLFELLRAGQ